MLCPQVMFSYHSEKDSQIELKYFDGQYGPFGGFRVITISNFSGQWHLKNYPVVIVAFSGLFDHLIDQEVSHGNSNSIY